jgi:hypothetical protein
MNYSFNEVEIVIGSVIVHSHTQAGNYIIISIMINLDLVIKYKYILF